MSVRCLSVRPVVSALLMFLYMGAAPAAQQAEPRRLPSGAELLAGDARHLSPAYAPCMARADALDARRRCVDAEFKVHDNALNAAYLAARSAMSSNDQGVLRALQRQWLAQRDSRCPDTGVAATQLDVQQCRTHMTLLRARQLQGSGAVALVAEAKASLLTQAQVAPFTADAAPDEHGRITLQPGQGVMSPALQLTFKVADCSGTDSVTTCQVQAMDVTRDGRAVAVTGVQPRLTRAAVDARAASAILLTVADLNGDGTPDLQVWQDNNGVYNVPVYAFYLFDTHGNRYVRASALEAAIAGRDIDQIDNGRFVLRAQVSPCVVEDEVIQLRGSQTRTLLERRYDTCKGEAPTERDLLNPELP